MLFYCVQVIAQRPQNVKNGFAGFIHTLEDVSAPSFNYLNSKTKNLCWIFGFPRLTFQVYHLDLLAPNITQKFSIFKVINHKKNLFFSFFIIILNLDFVINQDPKSSSECFFIFFFFH